MLNQFQIYDLTDNTKRQVVETVDGLSNEVELTNWQNEVLQKNPVPEGFGFFVVAENSPWFVRQDDTHSLLGIPNIADTGNNGPASSDELQLLPYDVCGSIQLKIDEDRRIAAIEREARLAAHIASFQG